MKRDDLGGGAGFSELPQRRLQAFHLVTQLKDLGDVASVQRVLALELLQLSLQFLNPLTGHLMQGLEAVRPRLRLWR